MTKPHQRLHDSHMSSSEVQAALLMRGIIKAAAWTNTQYHWTADPLLKGARQTQGELPMPVSSPARLDDGEWPPQGGESLPPEPEIGAGHHQPITESAGRKPAIPLAVPRFQRGGRVVTTGTRRTFGPRNGHPPIAALGSRVSDGSKPQPLHTCEVR